MKINKFLFLFLLFIGFLLLGNLLSLCVAYMTGIPIDILALKQATEIPSEISIIKSLIGINHLLGFTISAIVYVLWYKKDKIGHFLNLKQFPKLSIFISLILLLLLSYPLIGYTTMLGSWIDLPEWAKSMDQSSMERLMNILQMNGPLDFLLNLLVIAILPGLGEEFIFRGIIQKELKTSFINPHIAIWITAIIFSAVHLQVEGFIPKMILGLIFGYAYHYTKNLWYPILLHIFNNGMQVVLLYFAGDQIALEQMETGEGVHWAIALISSVVLLGVWRYAEHQDKSDDRSILKIKKEKQ